MLIDNKANPLVKTLAGNGIRVGNATLKFMLLRARIMYYVKAFDIPARRV